MLKSVNNRNIEEFWLLTGSIGSDLNTIPIIDTVENVFCRNCYITNQPASELSSYTIRNIKNHHTEKYWQRDYTGAARLVNFTVRDLVVSPWINIIHSAGCIQKNYIHKYSFTIMILFVIKQELLLLIFQSAKIRERLFNYDTLNKVLLCLFLFWA